LYQSTSHQSVLTTLQSPTSSPTSSPTLSPSKVRKEQMSSAFLLFSTDNISHMYCVKTSHSYIHVIGTNNKPHKGKIHSFLLLCLQNLLILILCSFCILIPLLIVCYIRYQRPAPAQIRLQVQRLLHFTMTIVL